MSEITRNMIFGDQKKKDDSNINTKNNMKRIENIEISKMVDFRKGQPFSLYSTEKMEQMKESISRNGILVPIIVRIIDEDKYEIISGHNRVRCAKALDMQTIPSIILDVNDDIAELIMLETNLCQRDNIPPVEKGFAYKRQLEILKKIRKESDAPLEYKKSIEELANSSEDSRATIQRLIRLTELIKPLQDKVNGLEQVPIRAGVELSYLDIKEQEIINKILEDNNLKLKKEQAEYLRSIKGDITEAIVIEMFMPKSKEKIQKFTGKLNKETIKKYKEYFKSDEDFSQLIEKLLEEHFNKK